MKSESIVISNEVKNNKNFIQTIFANRYKAVDLETKIQQSFKWIGTKNMIILYLDDWLSSTVIDE